MKLSMGFFEDIEMWKTFIDQWNGMGLFLSSLWDTSDTLSFFSVASGSLGFEGIFHKRSFQGKWLPSQKLGEQGIIILWQELYAVNVSCHLWRPHWMSKRVQIHYDNQSLVQVINSGQFKVPGSWTFIMDLTFCTLQHNFYFRADSLSLGSRWSASAS